MDASCLSISQEEFDKNIEMTIWEMELERRTRERNLAQQQKQQQQQQMQQRAGHFRTGSAQQDMPGERAQWLIDRSSDLAKTTLEKTNNFVGRLISEFSTPSASESGRSTPLVTREARETSPLARYPGESAPMAVAPPTDAAVGGSANVDSPDAAADMAAADSQLVMGGPEWVATLALVRDMFPNIDRDVVDIIFEANAGVVARTIEQLLDISSDNEVLATATVMAEKSRDESEALIKEILIADAAAAAVTEQQPGNIQEIGSGSNVQRAAVVDADAPRQEHEDAAEEMERWKNRWADDSDDSDDSDLESEFNEQPEPPAGKPNTNATAASAEAQDSQKSKQTVTSVQDADGVEASGTSTSVAAQPSVPDTSGDEEYARKLQEEFERQAQITE
ncbi:hypothetical protein LPJ57_008979 [Coemansia sp. RSA 486]|nr:hypothetical protein LPJ57_008979 [Coemansia sp. RSA 486]